MSRRRPLLALFGGTLALTHLPLLGQDSAPPSHTDGQPGPIWASVTRAPSQTTERITLDFGTLGADRSRRNGLHYFVRQTLTRYPNVHRVSWADSRTCAAVVPVLSDLRDLPSPRADIPGFPRRSGGTDEGIAIDGTTYRLNIGGRLAYEMNVNTALARWTESTLRRLAPCWALEVPVPIRAASRESR